jgi:hypothetical protein
MHLARRVAAILAIATLVLGAAIIAVSVPGLWMVVVGGAQPGDPIYLDTLAPTLGASLTQVGTGVALVLASMGVRARLRGRVVS